MTLERKARAIVDATEGYYKEDCVAVAQAYLDGLKGQSKPIGSRPLPDISILIRNKPYVVMPKT